MRHEEGGTAFEGSLRVERRVDGRLWARRPGEEPVPVRLVRCFPWTAPSRLLSLRDDEDEVNEQGSPVTAPHEVPQQQEPADSNKTATGRSGVRCDSSSDRVRSA